MKQFAIILFVLIFVLTGKSQSHDHSKNQIIYNSVFLVNNNSSCENLNLFQNEYFDVQDTNDIGSFGSDIFVPAKQNYYHNCKTETVAVVLPRLRSVYLIELLLDLPPPVLSV